VSRSLDLLFEQARGEPLSPTGFSLSVHNAIGAQHSIARQIRANAVCIAVGTHTPEAGVFEAISLLHDGAREVVLVCHDAPLPGGYSRFEAEPACEYAWAARLTLPDDNATAHSSPHVTLERAARHVEESTASSDDTLLPHGLSVFRYLLTGNGPWRVPDGTGTWIWNHAHG
jgi:hypothetical protein